MLIAMVIKKIDMPDIDNAISEAKDEEQRKEETAQAEKIAYALEFFTKKAPDILKHMSGMVSQLDARKFAAVLREELKNVADEMAQQFNSKVEPMVKRAESADRRKRLPNLIVYIYRVTYIWLIFFLVMVIYANFKIKSDDLTALIVMFFVCCILTIIGVIYFTKKYRW
jgi:hypothetical protein